jgi:RNA polymerase primary sigma factor
VGEVASQYRNVLIVANLGLVLSMGKLKRIFRANDQSEQVSEAVEALWRSVDRFDVGRGFKFSTYACRAIIKGFMREMETHSRRTSKEINVDTSERPDLKVTDDDRMERFSMLDELNAVMTENRAELTDQQLKVLRERFWNHKTLDEVGKMFITSEKPKGLTRERVRQIEYTAKMKLLEVMDGV